MIHLQPGRPTRGSWEGASQEEAVVRVSHLARSWHRVIRSVVDTSAVVKDIVHALASRETLVQFVKHLQPRGSTQAGLSVANPMCHTATPRNSSTCPCRSCTARDASATRSRRSCTRSRARRRWCKSWSICSRATLTPAAPRCASPSSPQTTGGRRSGA